MSALGIDIGACGEIRCSKCRQRVVRRRRGLPNALAGMTRQELNSQFLEAKTS
jgi:hypothetical protein